jgi:hypothetical protein
LKSRPNSGGIEPTSKFKDKCKSFKLESRPNFEEIEPTREFDVRYTYIKPEQFASASGMTPDKLLLFNRRYCKFWRRPRIGMGPAKLLWERSR